MYYDKAGQPISLQQWTELHRDIESVAVTDVAGAKVSTVWIGIDHGFAQGSPPIIFETMVFGGPHDTECVRYSTEEQAKAGHAAMVAKLRAER